MASSLRILLKGAEVIAPDVPVDPFEAIELLQGICSREQPDLVIGTSMGGMYAEQLSGEDRICVNPALHLADTLLKNNGLGKQEFHHVRQDGQTSFLVTKSLLEAFREVSGRRFSQVEPERVYGGPCFRLSNGWMMRRKDAAKGSCSSIWTMSFGIHGTTFRMGRPSKCSTN